MPPAVIHRSSALILRPDGAFHGETCAELYYSEWIAASAYDEVFLKSEKQLNLVCRFSVLLFSRFRNRLVL